MVLGLLCSLAIVFCIVGVSDLIFFIKLLFVSPPKRSREYIFIVLDADCYRLQICTALQKMHWYGNLYCDGIVCLTGGLSEEETEECKKMFKSDDIIFMGSLREVYDTGYFGSV